MHASIRARARAAYLATLGVVPLVVGDAVVVPRHRSAELRALLALEGAVRALDPVRVRPVVGSLK